LFDLDCVVDAVREGLPSGKSMVLRIEKEEDYNDSRTE